MLLLDKEVTTIEQAFSLLPEERQEHCRRVSAYAEAAFAKIVKMDLYISDYHSDKELVPECIASLATGALYHDIGKLDAEDDAHTTRGGELVEALYGGLKKLRSADRRLILSAVTEHHEHPDGSGKPEGKLLEKTGFGGRIVAIADLLDHRALEMHSETPIADALKSMKADAAAGRIDPEFYKAFRGCGAKLTKIFDANRDAATEALPIYDPWIRRRAGRPMELVWRSAKDSATDALVWLGEMRFRGTTANTLTQEDVKQIITQNRLAQRMGEYFFYELCDGMRRFDNLGTGRPLGAVELPLGWYRQKNLSRIITQMLADEAMPASRIVLIAPEQLVKSQEDVYAAVRAVCEKAGVLLRPLEALALADVEPLRENEIADEAMSRRESGVIG